VKRLALLAALLTFATGVAPAPVALGRAGKHARIAFIRSGANRKGEQIWTIRKDGSNPRRLTRGTVDSNPAWSPEGDRIVFHRLTPGGGDVYVMSARGRKATRLTDQEGLDGYPAWSPDGNRIAYTHNDDDREISRVFVMDSDGTDVVKLTGKRRSSFLPTWSPNGGRIAFVRTVPCGSGAKRCGMALFVMDDDGTNKRRVTPFHREDVMEYPAWSPNGKWIAYDRTGDCCAKTGIWLVRPNGKDRHRATPNEARHPSWSPGGRRLVVDFGTDSENSDLWVLGRGGRVVRRLTRGPAFDHEPSWSGPR
jgi:TolB protein